MKAVFLFSIEHSAYNYDRPVYQSIFTKIRSEHQGFETLITIGDLLYPRINLLTHFIDVDLKNYDCDLWSRFPKDPVEAIRKKIVFCVCFESINRNFASKLSRFLEQHPGYIGALEVDDSVDVLYLCFTASLIRMFRIFGNKLHILLPDKEELDEDFRGFFVSIGFEQVDYEFTGLKYSVFDANDNQAAFIRNSKWKKSANNFLADLPDSIGSRLIHATPDLGDQLYALFDTFDRAETPEHLAQVMVSCRRIFEYVVDVIFPPVATNTQEIKLGAGQYRNRLYEFMKQSRAGDSHMDLVLVNTDMLFAQLTKLQGLANKGVHAKVYREEAKRCIIRTLLLLDDILSFRTEPFETNVNLSDSFFDMVRNILKKYQDKKG